MKIHFSGPARFGRAFLVWQKRKCVYVIIDTKMIIQVFPTFQSDLPECFLGVDFN